MDYRKRDARPSVRRLADLSTHPLPGGATALETGAWVVAVVVLLMWAGWRWHAGVVDRPIRVVDPGEAVAVLVMQDGDCPDRRAAMRAWLEGLEGHSAGPAALPIRRAVLRGEDPPATSPVAALPPLSESEMGALVRVLVRTPGARTPLLLVLDDTGHPLTTAGFEEGGIDPRIGRAARLLDLLSNTGPTSR